MTVQNLNINQGETFAQTLTTVPVTNLTGATLEGQIRLKASAQYPIIGVFACSLSGTPTDGTVNLALTAAQTSAFPVYGDTYSSTTEYQYDIFATISGVKSKLFGGSVTVSPAVTR